MKLSWILAVMAGGGLGSLSRFLLSWYVLKQATLSFPLSTFLANVVSCIILGIIAKLSMSFQIGDTWRIFSIIGFCGGLSTFSTFSFETLVLFRSGHVVWALANILLNISVCLIILALFLKKVP